MDILVGYNSDEGLSFSRERTPAEFIANVEKRYGPFAEQAAQGVSRGREQRSENRPRPDARRGIRLADVGVGPVTGADGQVEGLLLLL